MRTIGAHFFLVDFYTKWPLFSKICQFLIFYIIFSYISKSTSQFLIYGFLYLALGVFFLLELFFWLTFYMKRPINWKSMESEEPSKISYKIREKIRSFKVTFFTKIYICMMIGIYSIYNSRRTILSNHCTTVIEKSTKKVKKKVFPQNPNIFSVGMGSHCKLPDFIAQNIHYYQGPQNEF